MVPFPPFWFVKDLAWSSPSTDIYSLTQRIDQTGCWMDALDHGVHDAIPRRCFWNSSKINPVHFVQGNKHSTN
ncbi:hypothetical protein SAMD00019534_012310, partial [Acytostelium subglobosum LB1]|uniref:hypothetical protein n=1 Tax=Acytostelium subglobosum LB1 TaxID=1410327 RepID=UPI0006449020